MAELPIAMPAATPAPADRLPLARPSDRALAQARALWAEGKPGEALRLLEAVDLADAQRPTAVALRAEIQRKVLADIQTLEFVAEAAR